MKTIAFFLGVVLFIAGCSPIPARVPNISEEPGRAKPEISRTATFTPVVEAVPTATDTPTTTPTATFTPTPACITGTLEQHELTTDGLSQPLRFRVYLPPCFSTTPSTPYPVLYMLHGQSFNESQWDDLGMDEAADAMISSGEIEPLIIVMPGEDKWLEDAVSSRFAPALINTLIPWVDANYPTCAERACRGLGGLSRGGGWAMRLGIFNPDLFGVLGGHSMALFDGDVNYLPVLLTRMEESQRPKIYLDVGEKDPWKESIGVFVAKLDYLKMMPVYLVQPGAHNMDYWREHTPEYLRWYAKALNQP